MSDWDVVDRQPNEWSVVDRKPSQQSRPEWSAMPGNIAPSVNNLVEGIYGMVRHPLNTLSTTLDAGAGLLQKALPKSVVNMVESASQTSPETQNRMTTSADAVIENLKSRYGSLENFRATLIKDPAGALADIYTVGRGGISSLNQAGSKSVALAEQIKSLQGPRDNVLTKAGELGYQLPRSEIKPGYVSNLAESLAGKAATRQDVTLHNATVTTKAAAEQLGLPKDVALTEGSLDAYRSKAASVYAEAASLPTLPNPRTVSDINPSRNPYPLIGPAPMSAAETIENLKQVRYDANNAWKEYNRSGEVATLNKAKSLTAKIESLETHLENTAQASGKPELVQRLRDARLKIAQSYDIEQALNTGDASVRASVLGAMHDKGKLLTGNLETIGQFNRGPGRKFTGEAAATLNPSSSGTNWPLALALGMGGHATLGLPGVGMGAIPFIMPVIRHAARDVAIATARAPNREPSIVAKALSTLPPTSSEEQALRAMLLANSITRGQ